MGRNIAAEKARNIRYCKPMLQNLGYYEISTGLDDIECECSDVHYFIDNDDDNLISALDGDEDEAWEFKMTFADVEAKAAELRSSLHDLTRYEGFEDDFNDCTVALLGNRYNVVGYDSYEEDYFSLCRYEQDLATTEAGKRLMRMTKAEMISQIGQCVGIILAYADLRQQYESISAAMAVLRGQNMAVLDTIKKIEAAYERSQDGWRGDAEFNKLLEQLPDRVWIE